MKQAFNPLIPCLNLQMIPSQYNSEFQPPQVTKQTPTHTPQNNHISEKNPSSTKDRQQSLEYLSTPKKLNFLTQDFGQGAHSRISDTVSTGLPTTQPISGRMIFEKEPNSRNPQTVPVSMNDGHDRPEINQQNPVPTTTYPTHGGSFPNLHPLLENSGDITPNPNAKVDSSRIRKRQNQELLRLVHRCSQELLLESIIDDLDPLALRCYAIAMYDLDRHGKYQQNKPEEEEKTSENENSNKPKASKDSQLNYGYMSGTVGTLNLLFLAPSNKPGAAEERIRKILENCPANVLGCEHVLKGGCLIAFIEAKLSKLTSQKKKRQREKRQQDQIKIKHIKLLKKLKGAIQSGKLALPKGEEATFFQDMYEYGQKLKEDMLKSSKYTDMLSKKVWWPMLRQKFSLHLDNQDQHETQDPRPTQDQHPIQEKLQIQDQSPIQDQPPLQEEPSNEQPVQQDQQLQQGSPIPEGQVGSEQPDVELIRFQSEEDLDVGSQYPGQIQFNHQVNVFSNEDYLNLNSFLRTTPFDTLNLGPRVDPFDLDLDSTNFWRNFDGSRQD